MDNNNEGNAPQQASADTSTIQYSDFAGSASCKNCHKDVYNTHIETAHFLTSAVANDSTIKGSFNMGSNAYAFDKRVSVAMEKRQGGHYQVEYGDGEEKKAKRMDIVVGSGTMGQSFLHWQDNYLFQLPITYFTAADQWSNSPGFPDRVVFNRLITSRCLECHSTYAKVLAPGDGAAAGDGSQSGTAGAASANAASAQGNGSQSAHTATASGNAASASGGGSQPGDAQGSGSQSGKQNGQGLGPDRSNSTRPGSRMIGANRPEDFDRTTFIYGVDCEKCHGPSKNHVDFQTQHPDDTTAKYVINPKTFSRQQKLDMCALCHGGRLQKTQPSFTFTAGASLSDYFLVDTFPPRPELIDVHGNQYGLLRASKCFKMSDMTCGSCHDVHKNEKAKLAVFSQRCMNCHTDVAKIGGPTHRRLGMKVKENCVDCHMELKDSKAISVFLEGQQKPLSAKIRSHYIK